jgi:hypothetical protein
MKATLDKTNNHLKDFEVWVTGTKVLVSAIADSEFFLPIINT